MRVTLIIDANILFAALIKNSVTVNLLFSDNLLLYAPAYLLQEFDEHKDEIIRKSKLSEEEFVLVSSLLLSRIHLLGFDFFQAFIAEAKNITPDEDDTEYLALALCLGCALWSHDTILRKQTRVQILSTGEIIRLLDKI